MSKRSVKKKASGIPSRSPSLESTASQALPPAPRAVRKVEDDALSVPGLTTHGQYLFDCSIFLIYCPKHKNFALSKIGPSKGTFLPYVGLRQTEGWYVSVISKMKQCLAVGTGPKGYLSFSSPELIHLLRLQVPGVCKFVTRITYFIELTFEDKHPTTCCQTGRLNWVPAVDISRGNIPEIWGPESIVFVDAFLNRSVDKGAYTEYTLREAFRFVPRDPPKNHHEEMVQSAKMGEKEIAKVYAEFLQHSYPSQYMVFHSFADYMNKLGWTNNDMDLSATYRAIAYNRRQYISFHEFLLGLAAMDKHTVHGGHPGELRCGYIFRYYDANCDNALDRSEMVALTIDMLRLKGRPCDKDAVEKEIAANYGILKIGVNESISLQQLGRGVGTLAFRGSSVLFRASFSIMTQINLKRLYDSVSVLHTSIGIDMAPGKVPGTCPRCRLKKYTLALHSMRVTPEGRIADPVEIVQDEALKATKEKRAASVLALNSENVANKAMGWIREFVSQANVDGKSKAKSKPEQTLWVSGDRTHVASVLLRLFGEAECLVKAESRCIKISSPTYVFGDIHGNLRDLMIYERTLWDKGPHCLASSFLFLGDYVDRGNFGLEVVVYLFACKVLNSEKFFLLRGNHELRPIQTVFTFQKECNDKFGKLGMTIWEACNKVFDCLPLCAVIDESVFCAHGGIPSGVLKVEELGAIPLPMSEPERQSPAAWEILWNDPISASDFGEYLEMLRIQSGSNAFNNLNGFLPNTKRGTGNCFSEEAVSKFLTANGLSFIIRAHEVVPPGYTFHMGGKVITIFSSSRYCNGTNEAACIFVEQEKLRVLRLDTS